MNDLPSKSSLRIKLTGNWFEDVFIVVAEIFCLLLMAGMTISVVCHWSEFWRHLTGAG